MHLLNNIKQADLIASPYSSGSQTFWPTSLCSQKKFSRHSLVVNNNKLFIFILKRFLHEKLIMKFSKWNKNTGCFFLFTVL